jgi:hypothetical protein
MLLATICCCFSVRGFNRNPSLHTQACGTCGTSHQGQRGKALNTCHNTSEALSQPQSGSAHPTLLGLDTDQRLDYSLSVPPVAINKPMWWTAHPWLPRLLNFFYHLHFPYPFFNKARAFHRVGGLLRSFFDYFGVPAIAAVLNFLPHIPSSLSSLLASTITSRSVSPLQQL